MPLDLPHLLPLPLDPPVSLGQRDLPATPTASHAHLLGGQSLAKLGEDGGESGLQLEDRGDGAREDLEGVTLKD